MRIKPFICLQDTRTNNEDFAITPYIAWAGLNSEGFFILGLSLNWGYWSIAFCILIGDKKHGMFQKIKYVNHYYKDNLNERT